MCSNCLGFSYLKWVCLGWCAVSCGDFNLLIGPSAVVTGLHISGIKAEAVLHVSGSSCTLSHSDIHSLYHVHLSSRNRNKWHILPMKTCTSSGMQKTSLWLKLLNVFPPPAAKGHDYHFIAACHYSDAINGNELADNWFTITVPSSVLALGEPLLLIDSFLLSARSDWL